MYVRREAEIAKPNEYFSSKIYQALHRAISSCPFLSKHGRGRIPRLHRSAGRRDILAILIVYIVINLRPVYQQRKYISVY